MQLETTRLLLRPWQESDLKWVHTYLSDPRVAMPAGEMLHQSIDDSRALVKKNAVLQNYFAAVMKSEGHMVGTVVLMIGRDSFEKLPDNEGEIGFWLGPEFWGRGLIPEAVREVIRYAFEELKLDKLWSGYFEGNDQSRRVQEKCGFRYHHSKKDFYWEAQNQTVTEHLFCLLRTDWLAAQETVL